MTTNFEYIEYDTDEEYEEKYDYTEKNTGMSLNVDEYIKIDFENYPDIYCPFYPFVLDLPQESINNILKYLSKNELVNLRIINNFFKENIDTYSKIINIKFLPRKELLLKKYNKNICNVNDLYIDNLYMRRRFRRFVNNVAKRFHKLVSKIKRKNIYDNILKSTE
tara:strand:- start:21 stop:515 length:495 start_codon:yes stop_codon:yes gene_type:complete